MLARFGPIDIHITDFSVDGFRAAHDDVLVMGEHREVVCVVPPVIELFRFEAEVLWTGELPAGGRFHFVSGFHVERDRVRAQKALGRLLEIGRASE